MPAASNSTTSYSSCYNHYDIFAFTIPTLLTLVQMRYPDVDLFRTLLTPLTILLSGLVAYCFAFSFGDHANKWSRKAMLVFGSLSVASLLWILFFSHYSSYLTLCFLLLLVVVLGFDRLIQKLWQSIHQESRVAQNRISQRACLLLPMTSMN
ncbi:PREDICTED: PRUPE_2G179900, partial [Prunus dulcis]